MFGILRILSILFGLRMCYLITHLNILRPFHIDMNGQPAYSSRFKRTFGYYNKLASVESFNDGCYHVDVNGRPVYDSRFEWFGNFTKLPSSSLPFNGSQAQAPVRLFNKNYLHINERGEVLGGPYLYAGDCNTQGQSVVWDLAGQCLVVNYDKSLWCAPEGPNKLVNKLLEMRLPHKGIAATRDDRGWYFVDRLGCEVGSGRYLDVEPHYNGQARVRLLTGAWAIIDEQGCVLVELGHSLSEMQADLVAVSQKYWQSIALKMVMETKVLDAIDEQKKGNISNTLDPTLKKVLRHISVDMGLLCDKSAEDEMLPDTLTPKGRLLTSANKESVTRDRCNYWLQDRYFRAWMPTLQLVTSCSQPSQSPDTFKEISTNKDAVLLSQRVLASYAKQDWSGIADVLPLHVVGHHGTVVDIAGGTGSLLKEVEKFSKIHATEFKLVCVERPEVVELSLQTDVEGSSAIDFRVGDLFSGSLPTADLYLMSRVLHDWSDEKVVQILRRIHQHSPANASLCVIDRHATTENNHSLLSLHMYLLQKSHERTSSEWTSLYTQSGWHQLTQAHFNGHEVVTLQKVDLLSDSVIAPPGPPDTTTSNKIVSESNLSKSIRGPRKAVVPIAGLGTRMGLQSIVTPKALLPIISQSHEHGMQTAVVVQPALNNLLDQLLAEDTGIENVCIVAAPNQLQALVSFLSAYELMRCHSDRQSLTGLHQSLSGVLSQRHQFLDGQIEVVVQPTALGFGDAVLCARDFVGDEAFLVALGDHVFTPGCIQQMVSAYQQLVSSSDRAVVPTLGLTGACLCGEEEVPFTGLLQFETETTDNSIRPSIVVAMAEKPREYSQFALSTKRHTNKQYLSQLGVDILPSQIFSELQRLRLAQPVAGGEVDLRAAMKSTLQQHGNLYSCLVDGTRLDIGTPSTYWNTLQTVYNGAPRKINPQLKSPNPARCESNVAITRGLSDWFCSQLLLSSPRDERHTTHVASAPGRVDLMGGFADYSGSSVLQHATAMRTYAMVTLTDTGSIELLSAQVASVHDILGANKLCGSQVPAKRVLQSTIPLDMLFSSRDSSLVTMSTLRQRLEADMSSDRVSLWRSYIVGVLHAILQQSGAPRPSGIRVTLVSDLPWNTGLASSASVEMSTALAFGYALGLTERQMEPTSLALLCQEVENKVVGANCGFMDHIAVAHAPIPHDNAGKLVGFRCQLPLISTDIRGVDLPQRMQVVAVESGVLRSVADPPYKQVRIASLMGKHIIDRLRPFCDTAATQLCDIPLSSFKLNYQDHLPVTLLGRDFLQAHCLPENVGGLTAADINPHFLYAVQAATSHPIEEHARVRMFENTLQGLNSATDERHVSVSHEILGELMMQSHISYSKCGLGTAETDLLAQLILEGNGSGHTSRKNVVGAKISGGGGGGALAVLLQESHDKRQDAFFWDRVRQRYLAVTGLTCVVRSGVSECMKYHGTV